MRVNIDDTDIYRPLDQKTGVVDYKPVNKLFYTLKGSHDFTHEDIPCINEPKNEYNALACAKKVGHKYYIRTNNRGEVYNPLNKAHTDMAEKYENNLPLWKYVNVNYTCFAHYAHFLKTRQEAFLTLARRDIGSPT